MYMRHIKRYIKLLVLLCGLLFSPVAWAVSQEELTQLEAEMLKYFELKDRNKFISVTTKLKDACNEVGNERLFYKAWSNLGIYEAIQMNYSQAITIATAIEDYAFSRGNLYGEYMALHTKATILLQQQEYDDAEKTFQKAVEFHHRHFPNESSGDDLQELMKIANYRNDIKACVKYARQIVDEPNVAPIHKGRALYRISQLAFMENDVKEFNRIYKELMKLKHSDDIGAIQPLMEVNYYIMNGDFKQALELAEDLKPDDRAERKAIIYHRMGDDAKAYHYMQKYKQISDSIIQVSHGNVVSSWVIQMNNERMQLEQDQLERQNNRLRNRVYLAMGIAVFLLLVIIIWRSRRALKKIKSSHMQVIYEKKDAERALEELNELSFFESKTELDLSLPQNINEMCDHLADQTQIHCYKGVTMVFKTYLPDDYEMQTNPDALNKLLSHLLNYSARFTHKGIISLACAEDGDNILFSVTDTSLGLGNKADSRVLGMFSEEGNKVRYVGMNYNICQSITRLLHGRIWHDYEYTQGTRFCVEIPKAA